MSRFFTIIAVILISFTAAAAQNVKKSHITVDASELTEIAANFAFPVEYKTWEGTNLMVETEVSIAIENKSVISYFFQEGRYNTTATANNGILNLNNAAALKALMTKDGKTIREEVKVIVYVPADFVAVGNGTFKRTDMNTLASAN
jgi:hypothetical protein